MELKKLDPSFYTDNPHLIEVLDNINGNWQSGKTRGYGVVVINLNSLKFAIPLRTNIKHDAAYITKKLPASPCPLGRVKGKGLDFSKAVLIQKDSYISSSAFKIPSDEHNKLLNKEHFITKKFEKYVDRYRKAVTTADKHILQSAEYLYTTLQNYHSDLEL